jgi:hypothetical protein
MKKDTLRNCLAATFASIRCMCCRTIRCAQAPRAAAAGERCRSAPKSLSDILGHRCFDSRRLLLPVTVPPRIGRCAPGPSACCSRPAIHVRKTGSSSAERSTTRGSSGRCGPQALRPARSMDPAPAVVAAVQAMAVSGLATAAGASSLRRVGPCTLDRTDSFDPPTLVACLCESGVRETRTLRLSGGRRPA